jgi:hypothetical protein
MAHSRYGHTSTRLLDGRVLIVGGMNILGASQEILASAELYDPATGTFTPTGSMAAPREWHTATLLPDGRVLIAGGDEQTAVDSAVLDSAEIYDPATGRFSPTGSMAVPRRAQTATLLPDGRVLIAAGYGGNVALNSAEIYDPATGRFVSTGSMLQAHSLGTVTALRDGRVLVAGGATAVLRGDTDVSITELAAAELYDPATGKWSATGSMRRARFDHTATLLLDGRVLIAGGETGYTEAQGRNGGGINWISQAEVYDPATGKFSPTGSLALDLGPGPGFSATLLLDGRVLIAGGYGGNDGNGSRTSAELFDPKTGRFNATKSMVTARNYPAATLLADGRVLITGGVEHGSGMVALSDAELYQP